MFIDIHVHTTATPSINWKGTEHTLATPEQLLETYDVLGIEKAVLLPNANPEGIHCVQSNEEILAIVDRYPDRFVPFCNIDPRLMNNSASADLSYYLGWYRDHGCPGVGEVCCNLWFDDPRVENLFHHSEAMGMPLCFHVATKDHDTYGLIDEFGLPRFEKEIQQYPKLVWLCHSPAWWSHISGDVTEETWAGYPKGPVHEGGRVVELMKRYPTVYGDLSAGSGCNAVTRDPEFGYWFLTELQDQLCYGTDFCSPPKGEHKLAAFLNEAVAAEKISRTVYEKVAWRNAARLLKLDVTDLDPAPGKP